MANRLLYANELTTEWLAYQRLRYQYPEKFALKRTGLKQLDLILEGGIELGQYVLIGGAQKAGKTTMLLKVAKSFGEQGVNSVIFSAEMSNMQLGTMLFSTISGVERSKIRKLGLEIADWGLLETAAGEIGHLSIAFDYGFSSVRDITKIIPEIEAKTQMPVQAVFGDYIHLMEDPDSRGSRQDEIASISRSLKRMALNAKFGGVGHDPMAVIFAAQLNREAVKGRLIQATSFLGSGQLERDMDIGLIIHEVEDEINKRPIPNIRKITVVGSRETPVGDCEIMYNGATATLSDKVTVQTKERYWE